MKAVILCGGRGTRLGEHGKVLPKALIEIGGRPVILRIIDLYARAGVTDFVLCLGFLGETIREYVEREKPAGVEVTFLETGLDTNTGGRLKRVESLIGNDEEFCVTYGDGLADVDLRGLLHYHREHGKTATVTAVHPVSNFGLMDITSLGLVEGFREKPTLREWVNGGFFVFDKKVFSYLSENSVLEREPFEHMARDGEMMAFLHDGFWKCMDTHKDSLEFEELWRENPDWHIWKSV